MVVDLENLSNVKTDEVIKFILENISDLVVITNDTFEIEIINDDAHRTMTGYDDLDLSGKSLLETIHPKDRKKASGELRKLLKNGIFEGKTRLKCKNGEYIWLKIDGQTFYDTSGNKKIILVGKEFFKHRQIRKSQSTSEDRFKEMLDNLTEIRFWKMLQPKQAIAIYQESQEMLKLIMDNIPQYIAWKDKNLTYLGCNNNFLNLLNIENEEDLLGKKDFDLKWSEEYALSLYMNDSRVLESNAPEIHMIESWQNQEGVKMWFDINRIPLHDLNGNIVGILVTLDNITDRTFAEQQLKESEEMFRTIGEQSLMGIAILQDEVFKYINKQFAKIYGYTVDELLSWPELEYQKLTHPDDLFFAADQARKKQVGDHDVIKRYQFRGIKKSGETIWLEIFSKSISYEGYPADLVALIDVSEKKLAEQRIKDSEAKFRYLVSSSPAIIYTTDVSDDYGATFMSENLKILTGYSPEEFTSDIKFWYNHIHPDDIERIKTGLAELFVKNHHFHEYRFKFKDGTYHWMRDEVNLIKDENGTPIETIGYWSDVTEHKIAESKLRESEENYRLITENVNDLISVLNKKVRYEYINEQAHLEILGYKKEDLLGKSIVSFVHPDDREIGIEMLKEGRKAGKEKGVFRVKHKDGHYLWVEVKGKLFFNNDNELKVIMISRDITKRKKAEEKLKILNKELEVKVEERTKELKLSKEKYQLITENVNDSIAIVDDDFNYEYLNKIFEQTFGYNSSEFIGKNRLDLLYPEDMQLGLDRMKELFDKGESTLEVRIRKKDGNYIWIEINGKIFYDNFNQKKALLVGRNITERKKSEQMLKESEEKYRLLFENSPHAIILNNEKGLILDCNSATEDIFGISKKELIGLNYMKTQGASLAYIFKDRYDQLLEQDTLKPQEFQMIRRDGKPVWINFQNSIIKMENDLFVQSIVQDITIRKKAENKLKESEEKFRTITENSLMGIMISQENEFKYVNEAMSNIYEFTIQEIMNWTVREFMNKIHPDDRDHAVERLKKRLAGDSELSPFFSFRIITKSGKIKWLESFPKSIQYQGKLAYLTPLLDITERKQAEENLKESEEKFRTMADNSLLGISIVKDGLTLYSNKAQSEITEYTVDEVNKWKKNEFIHNIHPDDIPFVWEQIQRRQNDSSSNSLQYIFRLITKSNKIKWVEALSKNISYQGSLADMVITRDITENKRAEEKLRESEKKLREQNIELMKLDEIKNDFITMAAHELKTPLISISGYTEYILTKHEDRLNEITPEIKKDLVIVQKNSKRLQNLMDQLLDVMKIESKKIELIKHPMNVKKIINNCIDELSYIINEKNHNLVLNIDEDITLNVDSERFFEIISNLLSNAVKFTPKNGKIELSCDQRDDGTYLFKVKDNGIGLKADELGKLFQKFQTIREYSGENYMKGTGIGLFISKGFVEAHGGKIWATSDGHNKGTTFSFTIPY